MIKLTTSKFLLIISLGLIVGGCAPKALYNYGDYSNSYYAHKNTPNDESALRLQMSIEQAIANANDSLSGRVAPGLYANLGYIYLKGGNIKKALSSFEKEKLIYPESTYFMDRMIKKVELMEGKKK